jgi:GT2 family glycosyltransferase
MNEVRPDNLAATPGSISEPPPPVMSVIVLNYNGAPWLERCLGSLRRQTLFDRVEILVADNASPDRSDQLAAALMQDWPNGHVIQHGENLGFCEGNNRAAVQARGQYLFFLNNDTWLEPDCLEKLVTETRRADAAAATPWVLNYADDTHQDLGFLGFDIFGLPVSSPPARETREVFIACGSACLIDQAVFRQIGGFDREFFMYADEVDLSWRVWIAGRKIVGVPGARVHHRGAAGVNPAGGTKTVQYRTNDEKRRLTNRNSLLTLLKNGQHLILLAVVPLVFLLLVETAVGCVLLRRLSFARTTLVDALRDCWRLRGHIRRQRKKIAAFRRRSDFWMLRFFRLRLNRWDEIGRIRKFGLPRVDAR